LNNSEVITKELEWLDKLIENTMANYFRDKGTKELKEPEAPEFIESHYHNFLIENRLTLDERKVITLALAIEIAPNLLDIFLTKNKLYDTHFSEFGGVSNSNLNSFIPTMQTALFLLSGKNREKYIDSIELFENSNRLLKNDILDIEGFSNSNIRIHSRLTLTKNSINLILYGKNLPFEHHSNFPASLLRSNYDWEDLVLAEDTKEHLDEIGLWLKHSDTLLNEWSMSKSIKEGYKALFYGSSGTGKTLTATLLGKKYKKPIYRIDLSQIVSKYIGETEKNLEKIFSSAEQKDWILFFDEADSLFGKRTSISSSNDKYANQETAYLLQRIEDSTNLIILATNLKDNFDNAFLRRFQSIIYFPVPNEEERLSLWQKGFSKEADLKKVDLVEIADRYELSGANITNVIRFSSLKAISQNSKEIKESDIIEGIRKEKYKEGKII